MHENLTTEFKREYTDDIKRTVIAFANSNGGELYIGIADDGSICGVDRPDETMLQITNLVRDAIQPDVTIFMQVEIRMQEDKPVIVLTVQKGTARPYYLASKGIRPEGVYVRQGSSTVPASQSAIIKMIRETSGDNYETTRSLIQTLSFESAKRTFKQYHVKFGIEQQRSLGLIGEDGTYTNLGLLLSDQCQHTIKIAVFEGKSKFIFRDRMEIGGSLFKQLDEGYAYIDRFNLTRAEISGLLRVETRNFPPVAVREALLNTLVHRDYSYSASSLISVFDDRLEYVTLGGLMKGLAYEDLEVGVSVLRNSRLAEVFYRLRLIEAFGTGIPKVMGSYEGQTVKATIEVSENAFKITLPNVNLSTREVPPELMLNITERRILDYLASHPNAGRKEMENTLNLSQSATIRALKSLGDANWIVRQGSGRDTHYVIQKR